MQRLLLWSQRRLYGHWLRSGRYTDSYDSRSRQWRDWNRAGYWERRSFQADKYARVARFVGKHCQGIKTVHECGCGPARNLDAILEQQPTLEVSGNDISRSVPKFFSPRIRERMAFTGEDTMMYLKRVTDASRQVDVVLCVDHLIHIPPDAIVLILKLMARYARSYIVLHEGVRRSPSRTKDFWYAHDYSLLDEAFELIATDSWEDGPLAEEYEFRCYRRRGSTPRPTPLSR